MTEVTLRDNSFSLAFGQTMVTFAENYINSLSENSMIFNIITDVYVSVVDQWQGREQRRTVIAFIVELVNEISLILQTSSLEAIWVGLFDAVEIFINQ